MAMSKFSKSSAALRHSAHKQPLIPFVSKLKKMGNVDGPAIETTDLIKLELLMDSDNPAWDSKCS
jgi:hypothetical protein